MVSGSFSKWNSRIPMLECPLRKIYVRYIEGLTPGEYELIFIVNGTYQLNNQYGIIEHDTYGLVNVIEVPKKFKLIAKDLME